MARVTAVGGIPVIPDDGSASNAISGGAAYQDKANETAEATRFSLLQQAIRAQLVAMLEEPLSGASLQRLGRFCDEASRLLAMVEAPGDAISSLRRRLGGLGPYVGDPVMNPVETLTLGPPPNFPLAPAPPEETYGTNVSRGILESAGKMLRDYAEQMRAPRQETLVELISARRMAKVDRMPKHIIKALDEKIAAASKPNAEPV